MTFIPTTMDFVLNIVTVSVLMGGFLFADGHKRLLLHDDADLRQAYQSLVTEVNDMKSTISKLTSSVATLQSSSVSTGTDVGIVYVRWGKASCPANGTNLIYTGLAAGFNHAQSGGATNHICLPRDPQWAHYEDAVSSGGKVYGVEYQFGQYHSNDGSSFFGGKHLYNEDAPCSVCQSARSLIVMIPGRLECYPGWTKEYNGYLVSDNAGHLSGSEYICLDAQPEVLMGGHVDENGRLFYLVEGVCGSLKCPPYVEGRELTCVVCTK